MGTGEARIGLTAPKKAISGRNLLFWLAGFVGLVTLGRLVYCRNYNYDEISHAHMAWLVSIGEIPYQDFGANHFPFFWITLSPLMGLLPQGPVALVLLRVVALLLNAIFIISLGAMITRELGPSQRAWAAACLAMVVFSPLPAEFLIEFRPDALANALLFSALWWLCVRGAQHLRETLPAGFMIGMAVLINTKYLLLPFVMAAVILVIDFRRTIRNWPFAMATTGGFAAAWLAGLALLHLKHISLSNAWRMVVTYNSTVEKHQSYGFGLAGSLFQSPFCLLFILLGALACLAMVARRKWRPKPIEIAILVFLVLNLCMTTRPWKQYTASWFLLAAGFPARSLPLQAERLGSRVETALAAVAALAVIVSFVLTTRIVPAAYDRKSQDQTMEYVLKQVPPDGYVFASYYNHPIFRRDSLFKTVYDEQAGGGDGLEQFMPGLAPGAYGEHFQEAGYDRDLAARWPAVILKEGGYTTAEMQAATRHILQHPGAYEQTLIPGTSYTVFQSAPTNSLGTNRTGP